MKHIVFFIYLITFMLGLIIFTLGVQRYHQNKSLYIKHLLYTHGFFSLILMADILNLYGMAFFSRYHYTYHYAIMFLMLLSSIGFVAYLYRSLFEVTGTPILQRAKYGFIVASLILVIVNIVVVPLGIGHTITLGAAIHTGFFASNLFIAVHMILFFYITFKHYAMLSQGLRETIRLVFLIAVLFIPLSILLNISGYKLNTAYPVALSPLIYALINGVILIKARGDLYLSSPESNENKLSYESLRQHYEITPREFEIMELISDGCTNQIISEKLDISPNTVRNHIARIFKKLGVANRFELINYMLRGELPDSFDHQDN